LPATSNLTTLREDYDERRTQTLELFGYVVLRFPNERVLADPGGILDDILAALRSGGL
jgi:very-short-patch-repair endonuclease